MRSTSLVFSLFALMIAGCVSAPDPSSTREGAMAIGAKSFSSDHFTVILVPSSGAIADATFIAVSASTPSAMAHDIAEYISRDRRAPVNLVFTGPNSAKTKRVLVDALRLAGAPLGHVSVVFIGSSSDAEDVQSAVSKSGAKYVPAVR